MMKPLAACSLYTFVDTAYLRGRDPLRVAAELCEGGSDIIQLRAKDLTPKEIAMIGTKILPIATEAGVWLVINDHPQIARQIGAPLVHLGQEDFFQMGVSAAAGQVFGLSSHAPEEAERAIAADAAYIAIGPVYPTPTKPTVKPVTLEYVRWAAANVRLPWFAIGGINLQNMADVLAAGATRVCVVSAILNSPDIRQACQDFKRRLTSAARV
ncbi:MAG TPA: thiamine phosphate synthase [Candidatus Binatia bacterium]|nr:thiamine phosphate synthase [Candidatus Binatia bacterium]